MDEITLTLPREKPFFGIANLVLAGLATRLPVTVETLEDLQIALESVLERERTMGDVTVALRVGSHAIETSVGPFGRGLGTELAQSSEGDVGLRRILETVTDRVEVDERDGESWLALTKMLTPAESDAT